MSGTGWDPSWLQAVAPAQRDLWRGVEAQHRVATMRLVDNLAEQDLLEQVLEASKPKPPPAGAGTHYLLFTPFRYASPWASRFRKPDWPGAWYGADEPATVAAELAFWRWRFFSDSTGLQGEQVVTEHTFFQARFAGLELDITGAPWSSRRDLWRHPDDYLPCQELAAQARRAEPAPEAIRHESARREGGMCQVVFTPARLSIRKPNLQQTWVCKVASGIVLLVHEREAFEFRMA